jgi:hypothetical protein
MDTSTYGHQGTDRARAARTRAVLTRQAIIAAGLVVGAFMAILRNSG